MNRNWVCQQVAAYLEANHLTKVGFANKAGVSERTVRRLLNSEEIISDQFLIKMMAPIRSVRFMVVGLNSGKIYHCGYHHADCTRWINDQAIHGRTAHSYKRIRLNIKEPMIIQHLPSAS